MNNGSPTPDWGALIRGAASTRPTPVQALRHDGGLQTATRPQKYTCDDAQLYAVKFKENQHGDGKGIFAEQVVAGAGHLISAPVPEVRLVGVAEELVAGLRSPTIALGFDPQAGTHPGSRWLMDYSDRMGLDYVTENREAFGALEVLYTWTYCAGDHQFIYSNTPPRRVVSVDHTVFLPNGPNWTEADVATGGPRLALDPTFASLNLTETDRAAALAKLGEVDESDIAELVAIPPTEWGVTDAERRAVRGLPLETEGRPPGAPRGVGSR